MYLPAFTFCWIPQPWLDSRPSEKKSNKFPVDYRSSVLFQIDGTEVTTDEKETHKSLTYKITFRKKSILDKLSKILNSNLFFFFKNISALENQIPIFYICVHQNLFTGY